MLKLYVAAKTRLLDAQDWFDALRKDEGGAAMIEYALLVGLIAVVGGAALITAQGNLRTIFTNINSSLGAATATK